MAVTADLIIYWQLTSMSVTFFNQLRATHDKLTEAGCLFIKTALRGQRKQIHQKRFPKQYRTRTVENNSMKYLKNYLTVLYLSYFGNTEGWGACTWIINCCCGSCNQHGILKKLKFI